MSEKNPSVDGYIRKNKQWGDELKELRRIILDTGLTEEVKWMSPCYTWQGKNIVLLHVFKEYCAMLFHKGVLLKDPLGILIQQTEHVQSARQIRFTGVDQIIELEAALRDYVEEAIEVEKAGLEVQLKETSEVDVPEEFQQILDQNPALQHAFQGLTPGRQRGYLLYFGGARQSKTRTARVERYIDHILAGKGLND